jgi:hypothetical protein
MRFHPFLFLTIVLGQVTLAQQRQGFGPAITPSFSEATSLSYLSLSSMNHESRMMLAPPTSEIEIPYESHESSRHFGLAVAEVAILEFIPWALAKWIRHWDDPADNWANVSSDTWWNNLNKGWEYDGDNFLTNMYSHPYHGALFFNAGRANGYTYWESLPFSLGGSMVWEYFGETFRPSFNDWIATGVTGSFFGEALYRFSVLMTDNTASGSERVWREIGGALVNPVRGFNRLITGETGRIFPNQPEHSPSIFRPVLSVGARRLDADGTDVIKDAVTQVSLDMTHGNLFSGDYKTPFSSFQGIFAIAFPNRVEDSTGVFNRASVEGVLYGWKLSKSEDVTHLLTARGIYDYVANPAFDFGQTAVSPELNSLYQLSENLKLQVGVGIRAILMGGTPSDYYVDVEGRNYDLGPGFGSRVAASLLSDGWDVVSFYYNGGWIWSQSEPSKSKHNFHIAFLGVRYPFSHRLAIGIDFGMYWRESFYEREYYDSVEHADDQPFRPDITRKNPIARLALSYVAW